MTTLKHLRAVEIVRAKKHDKLAAAFEKARRKRSKKLRHTPGGDFTKGKAA